MMQRRKQHDEQRKIYLRSFRQQQSGLSLLIFVRMRL